MDLATIQMDRKKAREEAAHYLKAVRERHDAEDEQILRGYRELAKGTQLINLRETLRAGGTTTIATRATRWAHSEEFRVPCLSIARADAKVAFTNGIGTTGSVEIRTKQDIAPNNRRDRIVMSPGTFEGSDLSADNYLAPRIQAMVPLVPPALRPKHALGNYHILWEADWKINTPPAPRDPALLKHIGGDFYAVLAIWDLTQLERAVLAQRG